MGDDEAAHVDNISDTFSNDLMLENRRLHSNKNTCANDTGSTLKLEEDFTTSRPLVIKSSTCKFEMVK